MQCYGYTTPIGEVPYLNPGGKFDTKSTKPVDSGYNHLPPKNPSSESPQPEVGYVNTHPSKLGDVVGYDHLPAKPRKIGSNQRSQSVDSGRYISIATSSIKNGGSAQSELEHPSESSGAMTSLDLVTFAYQIAAGMVSY